MKRTLTCRPFLSGLIWISAAVSLPGDPPDFPIITEPSYSEVPAPVESTKADPEQAPDVTPILKPLLKAPNRWTKWLWSDAEMEWQNRTYYFYRSFAHRPPQEALATGGALPYRSGLFQETLRIGFTPYASQKLYGPRQRDGAQLLRRGQRSFITLGEAYLELNQENFQTRWFRQDLDFSFVNGWDTRMVPKTFESIYFNWKAHPTLSISLAQTFQIKDRNEIEFHSMAEEIGLNDRQHGLTSFRISGTPNSRFRYEWTTHQFWDAWIIMHGDTALKWDLPNGDVLTWSQQLIHQKDVGAALAGSLNATAMGSRLQLDHQDTRLRLAGTWTAEKDATILPFGSHPGYTSLIERRFNRAGENALHVGLFQKLDRIGLKDFRVTANYTYGWTPNKGPLASPDQSEFDLTLGYRKQFRNQSALWFRLRGAWLEEKMQPTSQHTEDYRIILQYDIPLL